MNEKLNELAIKIVLAHELGYALLHSDRTTRFLLDYTKIVCTSKQEREANEFTVYILKGMLGNEYIRHEDVPLQKEVLEEIASYWG